MLMAHRRVKILDVVATPRSSPLAVRVQHLSPPPLEAANSDHVKAMSNEIIATLRDLMAHNPVLSQHMAFFAKRIDVSNPFSLADFVASITMADAADLQARRGDDAREGGPAPRSRPTHARRTCSRRWTSTSG